MVGIRCNLHCALAWANCLAVQVETHRERKLSPVGGRSVGSRDLAAISFLSFVVSINMVPRYSGQRPLAESRGNERECGN